MRPLNISGSQAKSYYYEHDAVFGEDGKNSKWYGNLAKQFGLSGQCKKHDFLNIIAGNDPNGNQIIKDGVNGEHRSAVDIPFAAPKSISVMALHNNDKRLIQAHQSAIESTINYIEDNYIYARKTKGGVTRAFKTNNALFASFMHGTSRANDPHVHTHVLTMNMTQTKAGWRAIFNDPIFKDQVLINYIYQSELAKNVLDLGYVITNYGKGKWEISGFKKEWVKQFSKRSKQIDNVIKEVPQSENENDAKIRDRAQRSSRAKKDPSLSLKELKDRWQEKVPREEISKSVEAAKNLQEPNKKLSAKEFIKIAYEFIHETESTFTPNDVIKNALDLSRGRYTITDIEQAFYNSCKTGDIEHLKTHVNKKGVETHIYTSKKMRLTEESIVHSFRSYRDTLIRRVDSQEITTFIDQNYMYFTDGQKDVVKNILLSTDRFSIVQGDAGTGKTSALEAVNNFINKKDIEITGLGYTGKSVQEIINHAGIKSYTLHSFLNKKDLEIPSNQKIWVVDESSMVGSNQMKMIMDKAVEYDAKVIFIGDCKQLQAISAGRMFKDLQTHGFVESIKMEEALRQKTDYLKTAVINVKDFQNNTLPSGIDDTFKILENENRLSEIPDKSQRIAAAAEHFISHPDKENCLVVTPVNSDRITLNEIIHTSLKPKDQPEFSVNIHTPIYLRGTSRYFAQNYEVGQKAFIENSYIRGLKPGREVTIINVNTHNNQLTLSDNKKHYTIDLKSNEVSLSPYRVSERTFFKGEKIVFLKNDKAFGLSNGQTATILNTGPNDTITVKIDNQDRKVKINPSIYPYFDRGYALTTHKSQGQTAKEVIMVANSEYALNKTETFYVGLSRAENNFTLYGDKMRMLKMQFKEAQPKTSTIDFVKQLQKDMGKSNKMQSKGTHQKTSTIDFVKQLQKDMGKSKSI
jgi:conjugative relaxase-like TrwC/TraI family protein